MSGINGTGGVKVGELLRECMKALEAAGNDNPRFEAEQLVMKFCGVKRSDILMFPGLEVTAEQAAEVRGAVQRRNSGEPLQYRILVAAETAIPSFVCAFAETV